MASLKTALRTTIMNTIPTALTATSRLIFYTGSAPALTASFTGTMLATFTLASPAGTVTNGVLTFTNPANVTGAAAGTPGYWRMIDGATDDGTHTQLQGTAGVGSGEFNFGSTISAGGTVSITSAVMTEGNP